MDKLEYRKHISAMSTEGFALQTVKYERLSKWNYVIYQLYLAESLIDSLQRREPVLGDLKDANQCTALFHSAVMSYGRCFVGTALGLPSLDPKRVFQGASLVRVTHDELMDIRHNLIAHTGKSDWMRVEIGEKEEVDRIIIRHFITTQLPGRPQLAAYSSTMEHVEKYAAMRLNRYLERLSNDAGKEIVLDGW